MILRNHLRIAFLFCCTVLLITGSVFAQEPDPDIKAKFFNSVIYFVTWKNGATRESLSVCTRGADEVITKLKELYEKPGQIKSLRTNVPYSDLKTCDMLYIADSETSNVSRILDLLGKNSTLTVSSTKDFAKLGGVVGFYKKKISPNQYQIKLQINLTAAKKAGLRIDPDLLEIVDVVY